MAEHRKQDRPLSTAARTILALVDDDTDQAVRVLAEASTSGGLGGLRDVALALGQFAANRTSAEDAPRLVELAMDQEATR
ncbi:hypothetical protein [Gordonia neofelifaecis]|uniref:Uncharacterized protein n=1 Tax=Gordonia neofelifaecis NRRL B-59395 TaxID=644548 RepID=F1YEA1_9ACTN|nr:hypothetical protein [Gordonia neofelifaecis]EGD56734.1 hypothetical protein SCNU_00110 [Gordonia neofelifaecis NRRL B-59395]